MNALPLDKKILDKFGPYTLVTGILLIVLGTAGILLPGVMSLGTAIFAAWLLLIGGLFWALHTYQYDAKKFMNWLKPALLFGFGVLLLFFPMTGVAAVGLLLAIYLFLDAFGSFALAKSIRPTRGWGWMAFNGVMSFLLGTLFLIGWPVTSLWLVGLYVGISLVFDGWSLVAIGWMLRKGKP
ncbi:MAG: DUF308 domain-containing protein [Gallionella sp.]